MKYQPNPSIERGIEIIKALKERAHTSPSLMHALCLRNTSGTELSIQEWLEELHDQALIYIKGKLGLHPVYAWIHGRGVPDDCFEQLDPTTMEPVSVLQQPMKVPVFSNPSTWIPER